MKYPVIALALLGFASGIAIDGAPEVIMKWFPRDVFTPPALLYRLLVFL
jgi:hypothetical protein